MGGNLTIVIGAGPAGAACALWLRELGCPVLLVEKAETAGGLQNLSPYDNVWLPGSSTIPGNKVGDAIHAQLLERAVPLQTSTPVHSVVRTDSGYDVYTEGKPTSRARQLVLATGARFRNGGFTIAPNVSIGPGFSFEKLNMKERSVAILGGGDNAFAAHTFACQHGASRCNIFARSVRAQLKLRQQVPLSDVVVGDYTADQNAMTVNGVPFDLFAIQYGFEPVIPNGLDELKLTKEGFVASDLWGCTNLPGIYAIGEIAHTLHPCVTTSYAHGIQAAKHIQNSLGY